MIFLRLCGYGNGLTVAILADGRASSITMMDFPKILGVVFYW
jgi:hypothetical protein